MATVTTREAFRTVEDLLDALGAISPGRVRLEPPPGTAGEVELIAARNDPGGLCELVDGALVEKGMGYQESLLAGALIAFLREFVTVRNLGLVSAPDGMIRLQPGLVRLPDVAFASWARIPGGRVPSGPIAGFVPELVVEITSASNTPGEMARKRREYFEAGVRLLWEVDPETRSVDVYTRVDEVIRLGEVDTLDGGEVLPGFRLPLTTLFAELDRQAG
jgi:Uma2 family endonuclease